MSVRGILAILGTSVVSNTRDTPDESEDHLWCNHEQVYEDALLRSIEDAARVPASDRERGDDLRWERDMLMADARVAAGRWGLDCAAVERCVGMARAVNHDLVYALRCGGAL